MYALCTLIHFYHWFSEHLCAFKKAIPQLFFFHVIVIIKPVYEGQISAWTKFMLFGNNNLEFNLGCKRGGGGDNQVP